MNTIFSDPFPDISNQAELDSLVAKYSNYDVYYVASGSIKDRRKRFDTLYPPYKPYADNNFLTEVKTQFHQRTWEMYLGYVFLKKGVTLVSTKNKGPDFLISYEDKKVWVECIACTRGTEENKDKVPSIAYGISQTIPEDEMCIRLAGALKDKYDVYKDYVKKGIVSEKDIFIIAINAGAFGYPEGVIPLILKCLFRIGYPTISFPIGGGSTKHGWSTRSHIERKNGSPIPMDFFLNKEHSGISGILYDKNNILNHSDVIGEDIVAISNPLATFQFPKELLSFPGYYFDIKASEWTLTPQKLI